MAVNIANNKRQLKDLEKRYQRISELLNHRTIPENIISEIKQKRSFKAKKKKIRKRMNQLETSYY